MDDKDWKEVNDIQAVRWLNAVQEAGKPFPLLPDLLAIVAGYAYTPAAPRYQWLAIDVDDFVCEYQGICLQVEQMDADFWWWSTWYDAKSDTSYDVKSDLCSSDDFCPNAHAYTWREACTYAENAADHILRHWSTLERIPPLIYLQQTRPMAFLRESYPFPDFPDFKSEPVGSIYRTRIQNNESVQAPE